RIGVLVGPDGVFMVDASYASVTDKVVAAIRQVNAGPIRFLVNTHSHPDHTGGDANFARLGALVIAREEARIDIARPLPAIAAAAAAGATSPDDDPNRLPVLTFSLGGPVKVHFDGETIDIIAVPASHTDGDAIIRFENADVMMIGDFYRSYGYPFADTMTGG